MTGHSLKNKALLYAFVCAATMLPLHGQMTAQATESHAQIMKKLAADLTRQAELFSTGAEEQGQSEISKFNIDKLRPALNRQRQTLLTAKPLLGLLGSAKKEQPVSNEVVGSLPDVSAETKQIEPMVRFRQKLARLAVGAAKSPLTILHIGNSKGPERAFTEGLRTALQSQFGDGGAGMVAPLRNVLDQDAASYELTKAGRWRSDTILHDHRHGFGLSAMRSTSRSSLSSMTFTSKNGAFDWVGVTIATGPSQGTFTLKVGEIEEQFDAQAKEPGSRFFKLAVKGESATIQPGGGAQTAVLNWGAGKETGGVRLVHFELPSDNAKAMRRLKMNLVANDLRNLRPDLILFDSADAQSEASKLIADLVLQMRASAPQADFVYMSSNQAQISAIRQTCLSGLGSSLERKSARRFDNIKGTASWTWSPSREDVCSPERQLQEGLSDLDVVDLSPDLGKRRAAALVKWLTGSSNKSEKLARN